MQTDQSFSTFYSAPVTGASRVAVGQFDAYLALNNLSWNHLRAEKEQINQLIGLEDNWDGNSSLAVNPTAAIWARDAVLPALYNSVSISKDKWAIPHITASESGEIVFEWWNQEKKITLYVGETSIEFIKVWGADIEHEMEAMRLEDAMDFRPAWTWLFS